MIETVSVFGSNDPQPGSEQYEFALATGRILAQQGYAIANGGYGGTMQASAQGARSAGGVTYGVICDIWSSEPNEYIDNVVRTSSYHERLNTLIDFGKSGYVVLPGATGTLVEIAMVWEYSCKHFWEKSGQQPRPIVCLGEFWTPLREMMAKIRPGCEEYVHWLAEPEGLIKVFPGLETD